MYQQPPDSRTHLSRHAAHLDVDGGLHHVAALSRRDASQSWSNDEGGGREVALLPHLNVQMILSGREHIFKP